MTVLARDAVASDHLVYAWPFPIGPECEVACADDEQVVMCPAWMVGDRLGPGRHRWRTPDPSRPVGAFFVLTAPVEVSFDMVTSFMIPATGQPVRLRASGSLQVRCADPGLLIAQFVGLPFDRVNEGVLRSVSRSVERMLARLLTRRVVMSGTPMAVTDGGMLPGIIEELIAYNPTAGAVFGVELIRMGHLVIVADDGQAPYLALPSRNVGWSAPPPQANGNGHHHPGHYDQGHYGHQQPQQHHDVHAQPPSAMPGPSGPQFTRPKTPVLDTIRGMQAMTPEHAEPPLQGGAMGSVPPVDAPRLAVASGEIGRSQPPTQPPPMPPPVSSSTSGVASGEISQRRLPGPPSVASGEISQRITTPTAAAPPPPNHAVGGSSGTASGEIGSRPLPPAPAPVPMATPAPGGAVTSAASGSASGEIGGPKKPPEPPRSRTTLPPPLPPLAAMPRRAAPVEVPQNPDEVTQPGVDTKSLTPVPGSLRAPPPPAPAPMPPPAPTPPAPTPPAPAPTPPATAAPARAPTPNPAPAEEARGSILGIGMGQIGHSAVGEVAGEIPTKVKTGARVLVPGPNGLMQSATVRQLLQGYYELEVGSSGETMWVPINGVVPES